MATTGTKAAVGGAGALGVAAIVGLLVGGPQTGLLQLCIAPNAAQAGTGPPTYCLARSWDKPSADSYVLSATKKETATWGNADFRYRKYSELKLTDYVEQCRAKIEPGPFAPPERPVVDAACGDPCGCNATHKGPVVVAAYKKLIPANGALVSWDYPTLNNDGTPVKTPLTVSLYRVPVVTAADGKKAIDASKPKVKLADIQNDTYRIIAGQPIGEQCYALNATSPDGTGEFTPPGCKTMRLSGPAEVGLSGPSEVGVE
jgi:hypothetical protein